MLENRNQFSNMLTKQNKTKQKMPIFMTKLLYFLESSLGKVLIGLV